MSEMVLVWKFWNCRIWQDRNDSFERHKGIIASRKYEWNKEKRDLCKKRDRLGRTVIKKPRTVVNVFLRFGLDVHLVLCECCWNNVLTKRLWGKSNGEIRNEEKLAITFWSVLSKRLRIIGDRGRVQYRRKEWFCTRATTVCT